MQKMNCHTNNVANELVVVPDNAANELVVMTDNAANELVVMPIIPQMNWLSYQ